MSDARDVLTTCVLWLAVACFVLLGLFLIAWLVGPADRPRRTAEACEEAEELVKAMFRHQPKE